MNLIPLYSKRINFCRSTGGDESHCEGLVIVKPLKPMYFFLLIFNIESLLKMTLLPTQTIIISRAEKASLKHFMHIIQYNFF